MATGYDPSKELHPCDRQSPDAPGRHTRSRGEAGGWREASDESPNRPDIPRRGHSWRTAPARGGGASSKRGNVGGTRGSRGRFRGSFKTYRGRAFFPTRGSFGDRPEIDDRMTPQGGDRDRSVGVSSAGQQRRPTGPIAMEFSRRSGRAGAAKTRHPKPGGAGYLPAGEKTGAPVLRDGPGPDKAARWRPNPRGRPGSAKADFVEDNADSRSFSDEDAETCNHSSNPVSHANKSRSHQQQRQSTHLHGTQLRRKATVPSFTNQELESFLDERPQDALLKLVTQKEKFEALLAASELEESTLLLIVRVMSCTSHLDKVCETMYTGEVSVILSMIESSVFLSKHLTRYLVGLSLKQADDCDDADTADARNLAQDVDMMLDLLRLFLQRKPSACSEVGVVLVFLQKVVTAAALSNSEFDPEGSRMGKVEEVKECCRSIEESQKMARGRIDEEPPPNNFREIPIFPRSTELRQIGKPFLRKNIVRGRYDSVEHYLDVQFRLLREDFVAPMREGITEFLSTNRGRLQNIRVYHNVFVESQRMETVGIVHTLKFELRRRRPERWETSKRLLYGSFVCLSSNNFKNIVCATVENRNVQDLQNGSVHVRFLTEVSSQNKGPFTMAESAAYFEAYRHVLKGLQEISETNFPFKKYIVDVTSKVEDPPAYLQGDEEVAYDLRLLVEDSDDEAADNHQDIAKAAYVPILDPGNWPSAEALHLDDSQLAALQTALTKEFAIIQGPPGTGKTYIGLKIVELLLYNSPWNNNLPVVTASPILVVCYTNHALDQFLEGIVAFGEENVVRVGSRSSSETLQDKNLSKLRMERFRSDDNKRVTKLLVQRDREIQQILAKLRLPNKDILSVQALEDFMTPASLLELSPKQYRGKAEKVNKIRAANLLKWLKVGYNSNKKEGNKPDKESEDSGAKDSMEVEDEGAVIQQERQLDDSDDFLKDRHRHRQDVEREERNKIAARTTEHTLDSRSVAEMQKSDVMAAQRASSLQSIWKLNLSDRWRLYRLWVSRYKDRHEATLAVLRESYEALSKQQETLKALEDLEILREANVIGMTTTGAARCRNILQRLGPRIVVVEEAAEVLEAHIITTLTAECQHLILIGDHQQLRPNPTVYRLAKLFNLDTSLFERMINNGVPCKTLSHQHRMRPQISKLMKRHFYKGLHDDESVLDREDVRGMQRNMFFITHQRLEDEIDDDRTRSNLHEAGVVVGLCRYLLYQGYCQSQITILTTYKGQLFCIRRLMDKATFGGVRVSVVDNFQGEENDIILLSLVRSNEEGSIGFLRTENRVCVALSRARVGFYCIGNFTILKKAQIWKNIIATLEAENEIDTSLLLKCQNHPATISRVVTAKDFKDKAPCGGCDKPCEYRLPCGHVCRLSCHPYDSDHLDYKCQKPCQRFCSRGEHSCSLQCHESCKPCREQVLKLMPACGHEIMVRCFQFDAMSCPEQCEKTLACGHACTAPCGEPCDTFCEVRVKRTLEKCGHKVTMACSQTKISCPVPCPKLFSSCQHQCRKKCGESCLDACPEQCEKTLACGHACTMPCREPCDTFCEVRVKRTLEKCGHKVTMACSETKISCPVPCPKLFSSCQHQCRKKCGESCLDACPEQCARELVCGHPCKELCREPCTSYCKAMVRRILPTCRHKVVMDCGVDPEAFRCMRRMKKVHPSCGHDVMVECCRDAGEVECKTSVVKERKSCGHLTALPCSIDPDLQECSERCDRVLGCGHRCPNVCGKPCEASELMTRWGNDVKVCEAVVEKSYPSCSHTIKLPCHQDVSRVPCTVICRKVLSCGHRCPRKCSQQCPRDKLSSTSRHIYGIVKHDLSFSEFCREKCKKVLSCGHVCANKCGEPCLGEGSPWHFLTANVSARCKELVEKKLPGCGHAAQLKCHQDASTVSCDAICGKTLPCGHACRKPCGRPCDCLQKVRKTLPNCDHTAQLPCVLDVSSYLCKERCERRLACGHPCPNFCRKCVRAAASMGVEVYHRINVKCTAVVRKVLPCGHAYKGPCCLADDQSSDNCREPCTETLACGHKCRGSCGRCSQGKLHLTCTESCKRLLLCGHVCSGHCGEVCSTKCRSCEHRRLRSTSPLTTHPCPHNITNRQLKSKACILRCTQQCPSCMEHSCIGVCGEPCPPCCTNCSNWPIRALRGKVSTRPKDTFVYLPDCRHVIPTRVLDRMVASIQTPLKNGFTEIRPLLCPACKAPIPSNARYQDTLDAVKKSIEAAREKCRQYKLSPAGVSTSSGEGAASGVSFAAGKWVRCPQGHVLGLEDDQEAAQHDLACPEC